MADNGVMYRFYRLGKTRWRVDTSTGKTQFKSAFSNVWIRSQWDGDDEGYLLRNNALPVDEYGDRLCS